MDIHALKIFSHLAESLHFGRTSRACHLTPSALTRTIQRIEEQVGTPLFRRDNRTVALTQAGTVFRQYAEEAVERWQALQRELAGNEIQGGEISLFCSVTAAMSILPPILKSFRRMHPGVQIKLQTGDAAEALDRLNNRQAEVTIAALPERMPAAVVFVELARTPLVFIAPADGAEFLTPGDDQIDWAHIPVILAERGLSRERIDRWFRTNSIRPNIYAEVAGNEALLAMVSLGCGVGVVPELVLEKSLLRDQVRLVEIESKLAPFIIGACTLKKHLLNPVIQAFWTAITPVGRPKRRQ
ncbi:MAG: HTH-type transcriptional activator IlvY [Proteobacteria bacterium]|nr:HTH-type transcriptional activator IlvY [Pseudomonadota bacterium]